MKTLTNCTPREFLRQTARIRHAVEKWLTMTDILNIRKRLPEIPQTATPIERGELLRKQTTENLRAMADAILDEHPDETADLLALCCFIEPEEMDEHPMTEYLAAAAEMIGDENVISFFTSLARWAQKAGSKG